MFGEVEGASSGRSGWDLGLRLGGLEGAWTLDGIRDLRIRVFDFGLWGVVRQSPTMNFASFRAKTARRSTHRDSIQSYS